MLTVFQHNRIRRLDKFQPADRYFKTLCNKDDAPFRAVFQRIQHDLAVDSIPGWCSRRTRVS